MTGRVKEEVIDEDKHVGQGMDHHLHQPLEAGAGSKEPHRGGDPLKLSEYGYR
jgi:hypothetical protein